MTQFVTNLDIFMAFKANGSLKNSDFLYNKLLSHISVEVAVEDLKTLQGFCRIYTSNLYKRWSKANRCQKTFIRKHMKWLESDIIWPACRTIDLMSIFSQENVDVQQDMDVSLNDVNEEAGQSSLDAATNTPIQRIPYEDLQNKQKKRRSLSLLDHSEAELLFALVSKFKAGDDGKKLLAKVINHLYEDNEKVLKVHDFLFKKQPKTHVSCDEALALSTGLNLSKYQYQTLRSSLSEKDVVVLPSYQRLLKAKKCCYPEDITVTETKANIKLQSLLDLTTVKILKVIGDPFDSESQCLTLISKWGSDGSSSHSNYKQKYNCGEEFSDSSVFMTSLVPIRLVCNGNIVWENPRPSSTHYCRPKMFEFTKETKEYIQQHTADMNEEIANLMPTKIGDLEVFHNLHMTMIDGKIATALSSTNSHATCNICLAKPKEMNNLGLVLSKPVADDMYKYGLSSLHMWIRCLECILHISYNLDFTKWSARGNDHKLLQKSKKELTQHEFFQQTGLLVDIVKQGFGTTNDGNTARRFFRDYERSSSITGVDKDLIKKFAVILQTISSGKNVQIDRFREYCRETAELFVLRYPWFYMPASVHKLLIHGADICQHFSYIPVGFLSEEASEARNKDFRNTRQRHSRKTSRQLTNEDIFHHFLVSSDPYITHLKPMYKVQKLDLFAEATNLLVQDEAGTKDQDDHEEHYSVKDEIYIDLLQNQSADPLQS